ncbi:MAG: sigma-70 family RNA polymerase sigma factor, partial [Alphaproteobacteria bacterium]|nr:sigma-70 family RNA polymerase sigma factor [Alphaproteobacteria bacterium]
NLCIDRRRRRPLLPADHFEALADPTPDALERLERDEWARTVAEAVRDLTPRQHAALVLCYYEGLSHTEAGEILSISAIAIESLVARARRKLRDKLQSLARPHA